MSSSSFVGKSVRIAKGTSKGKDGIVNTIQGDIARVYLPDQDNCVSVHIKNLRVKEQIDFAESSSSTTAGPSSPPPPPSNPTTAPSPAFDLSLIDPAILNQPPAPIAALSAPPPPTPITAPIPAPAPAPATTKVVPPPPSLPPPLPPVAPVGRIEDRVAPGSNGSVSISTAPPPPPPAAVLPPAAPAPAPVPVPNPPPPAPAAAAAAAVPVAPAPAPVAPAPVPVTPVSAPVASTPSAAPPPPPPPPPPVSAASLLSLVAAFKNLAISDPSAPVVPPNPASTTSAPPISTAAFVAGYYNGASKPNPVLYPVAMEYELTGRAPMLVYFAETSGDTAVKSGALISEGGERYFVLESGRRFKVWGV